MRCFRKVSRQPRGAAKPADFTKAVVDTAVQPKAVAFPTDAKLMHRARERIVRPAEGAGRKALTTAIKTPEVGRNTGFSRCDGASAPINAHGHER